MAVEFKYRERSRDYVVSSDGYERGVIRNIYGWVYVPALGNYKAEFLRAVSSKLDELNGHKLHPFTGQP